MSKVETNNLKKICLVSGAAFSAVSGAYGYFAPIAAALGLGASILGGDFADQKSLKESFDKAVNEAINEAKNHLSSTQIKILDELNGRVEDENDISNLSGLIKATETYRATYCTQTDVNEIIKTFEIYFRDSVAKDEMLSQYYCLNACALTINQLKSIDMIIRAGNDDLKHISANTDGIKKSVIRFERLITEIGYMLSFSLISLFGFSIVSMVFNGATTSSKIEEMIIGIESLLVFACYFMSFVLLYLCTKKYVNISKSVLSNTSGSENKNWIDRCKTEMENLLNGGYLTKYGDAFTSIRKRTIRYDGILAVPFALISVALFALISHSINVSEMISISAGGVIGIGCRFLVEGFMNKYLSQVYT